MRTTNHLFEQLCDPDFLERAAGLTVRGKRHRPDVAFFLFRCEEILADLQSDLLAGTYRPAEFDHLFIRDPKPRLIARQNVRDRIVQTALVTLMQPLFLRSLRPEAYACRPGYGTHRAVLRLQELQRRYSYALHLDIKNYFPSVDLGILRGLLGRQIRDRPFLAVVDHVLEVGAGLYDDPALRPRAGLTPNWPPAGRGLPIGSHTSQLFATHVYLSAFDHQVKHHLKIPGYLRYVDDLFFFADQRAALRACRSAVSGWLHQHRGLRLKHPNARILSCNGHLNALGYHITRAGIQALPRAWRKFRQRLEQELSGQARVDLSQSVASHLGQLLF